VDYTDIRFEVEDGIAVVTIDRPARMNAFRGRTVEELIHAFTRTWADSEVACVILTGAGDRAFCAGGDQKEYVETGGYGTSSNGLFEIEALHQVIRNVPKPVIWTFSPSPRWRLMDSKMISTRRAASRFEMPPCLSYTIRAMSAFVMRART